MKRWPSLVLAAVLIAGSAAAAQEPSDRPGRRVPHVAHDDPPVPPRPIGPDPNREQLEAFHRTLGSIAESDRRRARLVDARRVADFDLDWGLE